jgi:hypothetical protein
LYPFDFFLGPQELLLEVALFFLDVFFLQYKKNY